MAEGTGAQESEASSFTTPSSPIMKWIPLLAPKNSCPGAAAGMLPESICQVCLNLGNEVWDREYRERHGLGENRLHSMPAGDVAIAAQQGCPGCEIITWVLEPYMNRLQDGRDEVRIYFGYTSVRFSGELNYFGRKPSGQGATIEVTIKSTPFESIENSSAGSNSLPCPWRAIQSIPMVSCHTGSPAAVEKAQDWYSKCRSNHERCLSDSHSSLPTRVIQIQGANKARLHTSGTEVAEYACLSHCWGGESVVKTTSQTFEQYTVDIPWEELPKTFQDAIQFAHGLGLKYLWIDSLCIIQDSIDDWRHEGSRMSHIYANASLTLSATRAANSSQGCFSTLSEPYLSRTKKFRNGDHTTYEVYCHETLLSISKTPLLKRAWAFQERMLSRRIVHFMEQELFWECREWFHCECGNYHHEVAQVDPSGPFGLNSHYAVNNGSPLCTEIELDWGELVMEYSKKSLTYPSDIFPAIQALAKLIPSKMGRYLAGHWESTLISSLAWFVATPRLDELKEWRAPSWSWAAAQGEVWWSGWVQYSIKPYVTVISAVTIPTGDDPMGQISHGFIVLRAQLVAGEIQEPNCTSNHGLMLDGIVFDELDGCGVHWDRICRHEAGKRVFVLKLFEVDDPRCAHQQWLILEAVEGAEPQYARIGSLFLGNFNSQQHSDSYRKAWNGLQAKAVEMDVKIV